jgi:signal transduction histidine kinase
MKEKLSSSNQFKSTVSTNVIVILIWLIFTSSLAIWWWIYALRELQLTLPDQNNYSSKHMMIMAEGFILVMMIVLGGSYLLYLVYRDQKRHERLKFFFSAFTHDIKTSISRLRLQSDILSETENASPILQRLTEDIQRLDLQLENSLVLTHPEAPLLEEKISLQKLIQMIRQEFPNMTFELTQNLSLQADSKALILLFRNIIQNAIIHGKAQQISIQSTNHPTRSDLIRLIISNNGLAFRGDCSQLGKQIWNSESLHSNGLGLLIVKNLSEKMGGSVEFIQVQNKESNFQIQIDLKGAP